MFLCLMFFRSKTSKLMCVNRPKYRWLCKKKLCVYCQWLCLRRRYAWLKKQKCKHFKRCPFDCDLMKHLHAIGIARTSESRDFKTKCKMLPLYYFYNHHPICMDYPSKKYHVTICWILFIFSTGPIHKLCHTSNNKIIVLFKYLFQSWLQLYNSL